MIEATVKSLKGRWNKQYQALIGCRVSLLQAPNGCIQIGCILKTKKGSRIRKERYRNLHICKAEVEDIVADEYDED